MYLYNEILNPKNQIFISKIDWVLAFLPKLLFYIVKMPKKKAEFTVFLVFLNDDESSDCEMTWLVSTKINENCQFDRILG